MNPDLGEFILRSVERRGLHLLLHAPKAGVSFQLRKLSQPKKPVHLGPPDVYQPSEGQKAWSAALTKYHGIKSHHSAHGIQDDEVNTILPIYVDCRAIEHIGLFVLKILLALDIGVPLTHEEAVSLVQKHLCKSGLPFNCLIFEHISDKLIAYLHTHLLAEVLVPTAKRSSGSDALGGLQIGIVCVHSVCVELRDVSGAGDTRLNGQGTMNIHESTYEKVQSLIKRHIDSLFDSCGAQFGYSFEDDRVYLYARALSVNEVREYVASQPPTPNTPDAILPVVMDLSGGLAGLLPLLSSLSLATLQRIQQSRQISKAAMAGVDISYGKNKASKVLEAMGSDVVSFVSLVSFLLNSSEVDAAFLDKHIDIVKTWRKLTSKDGEETPNDIKSSTCVPPRLLAAVAWEDYERFWRLVAQAVQSCVQGRGVATEVSDALVLLGESVTLLMAIEGLSERLRTFKVLLQAYLHANQQGAISALAPHLVVRICNNALKLLRDAAMRRYSHSQSEAGGYEEVPDLLALLVPLLDTLPPSHSSAHSRASLSLQLQVLRIRHAIFSVFVSKMWASGGGSNSIAVFILSAPDLALLHSNGDKLAALAAEQKASESVMARSMWTDVWGEVVRDGVAWQMLLHQALTHTHRDVLERVLNTLPSLELDMPPLAATVSSSLSSPATTLLNRHLPMLMAHAALEAGSGSVSALDAGVWGGAMQAACELGDPGVGVGGLDILGSVFREHSSWGGVGEEDDRQLQKNSSEKKCEDEEVDVPSRMDVKAGGLSLDISMVSSLSASSPSPLPSPHPHSPRPLASSSPFPSSASLTPLSPSASGSWSPFDPSPVLRPLLPHLVDMLRATPRDNDLHDGVQSSWHLSPLLICCYLQEGTMGKKIAEVTKIYLNHFVSHCMEEDKDNNDSKGQALASPHLLVSFGLAIFIQAMGVQQRAREGAAVRVRRLLQSIELFASLCETDAVGAGEAVAYLRLFLHALHLHLCSYFNSPHSSATLRYLQRERECIKLNGVVEGRKLDACLARFACPPISPPGVIAQGSYFVDMYVACIHTLKTFIHLQTLLGVHINVSFVARNRTQAPQDVSIPDMERAVWEYKKLMQSVMCVANDIHGLVHNTLYNSMIQPSIHKLYNVYFFVCTLCVQLMDIYHSLSLVYGGGGHKYLYAYTINSSLYNNSQTILTDNIHTSKVIYSCIHALTRCVVYMYDMSMPTQMSASYLYACFYMMVRVYESVGSVDACIHYYNNIFKLFSQVVVTRNPYVLCKLYKDFAFVLYESGDHQQAQVIYTLAIQEYKTLMFTYIRRKYPDQIALSTQHDSADQSEVRSPSSSSKPSVDPVLMDSKLWEWSMENLECLLFKAHTHLRLDETAEALNLTQMAYTHFLYLYTGDGGTGLSRYDDDGLFVAYDQEYLQSLNIDLQ
eukprot:gene32267-39025_t